MTEHPPLQFGFTDSEVARVGGPAGAERRVRIDFAAACLAPADAARPREDAWFYARGLTLVLSGCDEVGRAQDLSAAIGRLAGGSLQLNGARQPVLGLTARWVGDVHLELDFRHGTCLQFRAAAAGFQLDGAWRAVESLAC